MKNLLLAILAIAVIVFGYLYFKEKRPVYTAPETETPMAEQSADKPAPEAGWGSVKEKSVTEKSDFMEITAAYPAFSNAKIDSAVKTFIDSSVASFKEENKESYPGQPAPYSIGTTYETVKSDEYLSVIMRVSTYTGGAHGNLFVKTFVFDQEGNQYSIGSFFDPGSNYLSKLSELSRQQLSENEELSFYKEGTEAVSANFEAFYITSDGKLTIIFQPYSVGPWVAGTPEVSLDWNSFGTITNEQVPA